MSKRTFNGQNDAPAPPQGYNQSVHDNPRAEATPAPKTKPATYSNKPQYDQQSIHQGGHSGLPVQPDGTLRESSNLKPAKKAK